VALPSKMGRRLFAGLIFGVLVYAGMALWADVRGLGQVLKAMPLWVLPAACALSLTNYAVRFLKWQRYLRLLGLEVERTTSALIYLSGLSMSITPGKMGEVFKSWLLRKVVGAPIHQTAPIVVAERYTDLLGYLILMALGGIQTLPEYAWLFWTMLGVCLLGLFLAGSERFSRLIAGLFKRLPYLWRLVPRIEGSFASTRLLLAPREVVLPTLISVVGWGAECTGFWIIADAAAPGRVSWLFAVFAYAFSAIAGAVLILFPGGLGITEFSLGRLVRLRLTETGIAIDAAREMATGVVILARLCTLWFAVIVGLLATAVFTRLHGAVEENSS
jgi:uncharacterized protein (TIRG00374 family)